MSPLAQEAIYSIFHNISSTLNYYKQSTPPLIAQR